MSTWWVGIGLWSLRVLPSCWEHTVGLSGIDNWGNRRSHALVSDSMLFHLPSSAITIAFFVPYSHHFIFYLHSLTSWLFILLVQAATRTETNDLKELLDVSREYITAVRVKAAITYVLTHSPLLSSASCFSYDVLVVLLAHQCTHAYDTASINLTTPPFLPFTFLYYPSLPSLLLKFPFSPFAPLHIPLLLSTPLHFPLLPSAPPHFPLLPSTPLHPTWQWGSCWRAPVPGARSLLHTLQPATRPSHARSQDSHGPSVQEQGNHTLPCMRCTLLCSSWCSFCSCRCVCCCVNLVIFERITLEWLNLTTAYSLNYPFVLCLISSSPPFFLPLTLPSSSPSLPAPTLKPTPLL